MTHPAPAGGDFGAPRLLIPAPEDARHQHLGWPKVVRCEDGTLLIGCLAGQEHTKGGCPAVARSDDGGKTFSELTVLQQFDASQPFAHSGNIAMGIAQDGAVVLLAMALNADWTATTIVGWRSEDSGASWLPVDTSALAGKAGSVYGDLFHVPGKGLGVAGHYRKGSQPVERGIFLAWSEDDGHRWGTPQTVSESHLYEPSFCFSEGRLVGLIRDDQSRNYRELVSDDLGETWAEAISQVGGGTRLPSPFITTDPGRPGQLLALQTERNGGGIPGATYLWSAEARELAWQRLGAVFRFPEPGDFGYPWMVQTGPDEWFVVCYCGEIKGPNAIWGMTVTLHPGRAG